MKRYASIIVFASLVVFSASAYAETYYRFEFYGSGSIPMDKSFEIGPPQASIPLKGEHKYSPGVRGGVRLGVDGSGHWGQDITYSYGTNATKIVVVPNGEFAFTHRTHQFAYNPIYYPGGLGTKKAFPYLTAGVGGTIFTLSNETINNGMVQGLGKLETHTSFTFNAGAGVRYQFNDKCGIRFDVRDWMSHPPRYGIPAQSNNPDAFVFPVSGILHQVEFSIGFVYAFRSK
jgi:opacity protein-like surface antigen